MFRMIEEPSPSVLPLPTGSAPTTSAMVSPATPDPATSGWPSMLTNGSKTPVFDQITILAGESAINLIKIDSTNPGPPPAWSGLSMNTLGIAPGPAGPGGADIIDGNKNGLQRWRLMFPNTENENGGNSGSNLTIHRYADDGSDLDFPDGFLKIFRSTGMMVLRQGLTVSGGTVTFSAPITVMPLPINAANDAAAAAAGVVVGGLYRSGSALMIRTV